MSAWLATVIGLLLALPVPFYLALRGDSDSADRLVALLLATSIALLALVAMSFAFDQPSFMDLPLMLSLLSLPGTLIFAQFLERWL
ncbi:monovalent cation/H+ antiporter complex subunit F [Bradyrhizobium sp. ISRA443]|uniref:monovalent cation/H+ antiporter complex subunit F n=1 Tax=unclassified Bradyrhizobium TaxID=2631580 RepID=UPI002479A7D4|nr:MULTISPECIES: monovalent cation/H+ antiporter complex subunit F [unclassified Bradyrhizobium]WGR93118.1 monovalent cation/H+ antiporter complex subunit F [Bradyrhizobium sp. ISRA435]WGR97627.1 monovalent cation/H+ antiporter complex subunit F [Bradyrhizobium sp. ISRA436]WGS04517.1 monovalent cation/H+ antiporter complex subunit F [Bradyrhizobium sp. ISRA437]WGS11398.1 monovalent cation/H+ antiporter complex subunit F [Bradyrhizobium sp. ISRA443]